jgi:hypothetical protein
MTESAGRSTVVQSGVLFPASEFNSSYLSRNDHRSFADGPRNKWSASCPPVREYKVFCIAEDNGWRDDRPNLWGIEAGLPEIGGNGECLAKFPDPSNAADNWHGYPVSARDLRREYEHRPKPALVRQWREIGVISETQEARINRGKV